MDRFEYVMVLIPIIIGLSIAGLRSRHLRVHEVGGADIPGTLHYTEFNLCF